MVFFLDKYVGCTLSDGISISMQIFYWNLDNRE